jgi:general secretion pathway protein C
MSLEKRFWILVFPLVALIAGLHAEAIGQLVGVPLTPPSLVAAMPATPSAESARRASADIILERNVFDHLAAYGLPADDDPFRAPTCDGVKALAVVAAGDPDASFAVLRADRTVLRRRGAAVNGRKVHFIGGDRVWLETERGLCQAGVFAAERPPAPRAEGIRQTGATSFDIDREFLDRFLEEQSQVLAGTRASTVVEQGRIVGIRMGRVGAALAAIGLEDGDRLDTVNGFAIADPKRALEAYAHCRGSDHLVLRIVRKGRELDLDYTIR